MLQFEWDPAKARTNLRTQGVAFKEAATVFKDPLSCTTYDPDHSCVSGNGAQGLLFSVAGDFSEHSSAVLRSPGIVSRSYPQAPVRFMHPCRKHTFLPAEIPGLLPPAAAPAEATLDELDGLRVRVIQGGAAGQSRSP